MLNDYKGNTVSYKKNSLNLIVPAPVNGKSVKEPVLNKWNQSSGGTYSIGEFSTNRLLAVLPDSEILRLMPYFQSVTFTCGENVYQPGDSGNFIYFPETAVFSQVNVLEDGRTVGTAMIGNEGLTGIATVLKEKKSFVPWMQTLIGGSALKINACIFKQEFYQSSVLKSIFFEYLNNFINQVIQKAVCNQYHLTEERFSTWLLMLDDRSGKNKLVLTHEQIAYFLGVHRPSITCIAQNLRDKGIINYSRGRISVINRQKLQTSACECYTMLS